MIVRSRVFAFAELRDGLVIGNAHDRRPVSLAGKIFGTAAAIRAVVIQAKGMSDFMRDGFRDGSIGAVGLLLGALVPTAIAAAAFLLL